jgi:hypothetical protein
MIKNKRKIKSKLDIRKKLISCNYVLDYEDAVRQGQEMFNDKNIGETWIGNAKFTLEDSDFDFKALSSSKNSDFICDCVLANENTNSLYFASIIIDSETELCLRQGRLGYGGQYEGKVICKLFDFEYYTTISISPKLKYIDSDPDDNDYRRLNFDALTDGQYGDYDDFNGDWDRLDDWRGAY